MYELRVSTPGRQKTSESMPLKLPTCSHVLRIDGIRQSFQMPYMGHHKFLHRTNKTYTIDQGSRHVVLTIDYIQPAFIDEANESIATSNALCDASNKCVTLQIRDIPAVSNDLCSHDRVVPTSSCTASLSTPRTNLSGREVRKPVYFSDH
ncbi:unnamed protein product, partial [Dicrocoelium dendriticum]